MNPLQIAENLSAAGLDHPAVDDAVINLANMNEHFRSAEGLRKFLESLHETSADGSVTNRKWEPAQRAAAALSDHPSADSSALDHYCNGTGFVGP